MINFLFFIFSFSQIAVAATNFEPVPYTDDRCSNIAHAYEMETAEVFFNLADDMTSQLASLRNLMIQAGDLELNDDKVLCIGLYDDKELYNAYAVFHLAIKIGRGFIKMLNDNYGMYANDMTTITLFHEFAHSIQNKFKWIYPTKNRRIKIKEIQADCMAGVFIKMNARYTRQTPRVFKMFADLVGDKNPSGHHGSPRQRLRALNFGASQYDSNLNRLSQMSSSFIAREMCSVADLTKLINHR